MGRTRSKHRGIKKTNLVKRNKVGYFSKDLLKYTKYRSYTSRIVDFIFKFYPQLDLRSNWVDIIEYTVSKEQPYKGLVACDEIIFTLIPKSKKYGKYYNVSQDVRERIFAEKRKEVIEHYQDSNIKLPFYRVSGGVYAGAYKLELDKSICEEHRRILQADFDNSLFEGELWERYSLLARITTPMVYKPRKAELLGKYSYAEFKKGWKSGYIY